MPELPEVETIRLQLQRLILGKVITKITIVTPKSFIGNGDFLIGKKIISLGRVAKMLVIHFEDGVSLGVHLKMTGQLLYKSAPKNNRPLDEETAHDLPNKHTRVILHFGDRDELYFNDQRRFGWMRVLDKKTLLGIAKKIGPDALVELTLEKFISCCADSKRPIKLILMDQEKIGGVGNIYANEALFYAGIAPNKPSFRLSKKELTTLLKKLRFVLKNGLRWGGASRTNFLDVYGKKGMVQEHFSVYDRVGSDCLNRCGFVIARVVLGGRGTFFCPACQR